MEATAGLSGAAEEIFRVYDSDDSGSISFVEFYEVGAAVAPPETFGV